MFPMNHYQLEERSRQLVGERLGEAAHRRLVRQLREAHRARPALRGNGRKPGAALRRGAGLALWLGPALILLYGLFAAQGGRSALG